MGAHVSSFGITFSPNERIIYRDLNNEPTTREHARFVVLQRFYDDGMLKEEIIEDLKPRTREDIIPRNGVMTQFESVCASRTTEESQPEPQTRLGFLRMFDPKYQTYVASGSEETHTHIPCGFAEMLDAAFPHGNRTTPDDEPHVVRGMGFAAMLEGARRGTE